MNESIFDSDFLDGFDPDEYKILVDEIVAKVESSKRKRHIK